MHLLHPMIICYPKGMDDLDFQKERDRMVTWQIERRGVYDEKVLHAMRSVPRHEFVPPALQAESYTDYPIPIGFEQTISQPYIVALMSSLLELEGDEQVLEIGSGSGYQAAILSRLAKRVSGLEIIPDLADKARVTLGRCGYFNVEIHCQDGSGGYPKDAPYHGILVAACTPEVPQVLLDQLHPGGRLVAPVGNRTEQVLQIWKKDLEGKIDVTDHIPVAFVPLRGKWGFKA